MQISKKQHLHIICTYNIIKGCISNHCKLTEQCVPSEHLILKDMKTEKKKKAMVKLEYIEIIE